MSEAVEHFDFIELGQAIMKAREQQKITREELAEELGISADICSLLKKRGNIRAFSYSFSL